MPEDCRMKNKKSLFGCALLLAVLAITAVFLSANPQGAIGAKAPTPERADVIIIDGMAGLGKLELPPVSFKHDLHTEALAKTGKDCSSCHLENADPAQTANWAFKFKRTEDTSYAEVKEIYHNGCLSCHQETSAAGQPSGPQAAECRSCHTQAPAVSERQAMSMDKYLHNTHVQADNIRPISGNADTNCSVCHHVYDPANTRTHLTWKKHEEDSCRACHLPVAAPNPEAPERTIPGLEQASHDSCLSCHFDQAKRYGADKSGPYNCAGCHSSAAQGEIAKKRTAEVPRLDRGQPDAAMLLPIPGQGIKTSGEIKGSMAPVAFDHKTHEMALDNCSVCHHEARIAACPSCHTLEGGKQANFVNLATAMHKVDSDRSCVGCHSIQTQDPSCAGCHNPMPKKQSQQSCASCHVTPVGATGVQATDGSLLKMDKKLLDRMAVSTVNARHSGKTVINMNDVPETVIIGVLANEYKPAELPHRKIVEALDKGMLDSKLAQSFHTDITTMCQGCHHNSPVSLTPPKCASCHAAGDAPGPDGRPPLKVAYHNQCMSCHAVMKVEKPVNTDCAGCHAPATR